MEREIIVQLLMDVSKIKVVELDSDWFLDKNLEYIVEDVVLTDGDDSDLVMMAERIKERHPDSVVSKEMLFDMYSEGISNARLEKHAKELKIRHHERKLATYSSIYSEKPDAVNYRKMKDAMMAVDELKNTEEDTGEISGAIEELYFEMENGSVSGVHTFEALDAVLGDGMAGGMLITIGARPGVGKTTYGVNMAIEAVKNEPDLKADFFSLEMAKKEMLKKFISNLTGLNSYKFVNTKLQLSDAEKSSVVAKASWLESKGIGLIDNKFTIDSIVRAIRRRAYSAKGKYIAFVDYVQLIRGNDRLQRYQQIGEVTRKLKLLTNELDIPIVIFSQINRGVESRDDKTPTLADLRESGDIEQDSNVVMFLHSKTEKTQEGKDVDTGIVNLIIAKNRSGRTAEIPYRFYKDKSQFEEVRV